MMQLVRPSFALAGLALLLLVNIATSAPAPVPEPEPVPAPAPAPRTCWQYSNVCANCDEEDNCDCDEENEDADLCGCSRRNYASGPCGRCQSNCPGRKHRKYGPDDEDYCEGDDNCDGDFDTDCSKCNRNKKKAGCNNKKSGKSAGGCDDLCDDYDDDYEGDDYDADDYGSDDYSGDDDDGKPSCSTCRKHKNKNNKNKKKNHDDCGDGCDDYEDAGCGNSPCYTGDNGHQLRGKKKDCKALSGCRASWYEA